MANRLKRATSPYLLQHSDNPVDWWPWSRQAFEEARRRDVPVLLSVGYAACHWCHVMAHESFEDPETAALVNENVVAIKVDREERPDIDAVYMTATQAVTGQGGWPMTVFMTPDGAPFFCGTYFPRTQFTALVRAVARAWRSERGNVIESAERTSAALAEQATAHMGAAGAAGDEVWDTVTAAAVAALQRDFDAVDGGFGGAPKFPPSMLLEFLLRHVSRTGSPEASRMACATFEAMARGGMYDQIGGGFARYGVDATWTVPHFEKMLYDNALLARAYTHWWRLADGAVPAMAGTDPQQPAGEEHALLSRRVAEETCEFMLRELRTPEGGFAASLDADSEGGEGAFYVWTPAQLRDALGADDGAWAARVLGVTEAGTFERGTSVLQRRSDPADPADLERLDRIRGLLFASRDGRPRPARDDKVVAAWNGMTIAALAEAGLLFDRPDFVAAAEGAASLLESVHMSGASAGSSGLAGGPDARRLARTSRDGVAGTSAGMLEDYACVASGLLVLSGVTGSSRWAAMAGTLLETVLSEFGDGHGGFFDTASDADRLLYRPADPMDNATPSGTFAAADALLSYGAMYGSPRHREAGVAALGLVPTIASRFPRPAGTGLAVAEALVSGPVEVAIVGPADDPRTGDLLGTAMHQAPPGAVFAVGSGSVGSGSVGAGEAIPLLAGRGLVRGGPAAYVCRGFTCLAPVTTTAELRAALRP